MSDERKFFKGPDVALNVCPDALRRSKKLRINISEKHELARSHATRSLITISANVDRSCVTHLTGEIDRSTFPYSVNFSTPINVWSFVRWTSKDAIFIIHVCQYTISLNQKHKIISSIMEILRFKVTAYSIICLSYILLLFINDLFKSLTNLHQCWRFQFYNCNNYSDIKGTWKENACLF